MGDPKNYGGDVCPASVERWTGALPLVRLGRHRVPEDEMSVGAQDRSPVESGQVARLILKLEEPGREKRVSSRNERKRFSWPRAGLKCTCSAIACVRWGGQRDGL